MSSRSSIAPFRNEVCTAIKYVPYHHQTIKLAVGTMTESFHTWLKTFLEISVLGLLFWCFKRVILMGQSEASHNLLQRKEINLWDWYQTTFSPSLNLNLPSWILAVTQNLFMISLKRDVLIQIFLFTPYLIHMIEKKLYSSWWMFNNLTKLRKIL